MPKAETARVTERLLADLPVIDLLVEDPPIEEVIERVFAQEKPVKALAELYLQQFKTTLATMFAYRASLLIWMIGQVLEPLVYLIVWSIVSNNNGGSVGDYYHQPVRGLFHPADAGQSGHIYLDNV